MPSLQFRNDRTFTIAQFTDLHYRNGEPADLETIRLMNQVLDAERPDIVVLTGDVIDGEYCENPLQSWASAVQPIINHHLPWAAVFGNHDDEGSATRSQLMEAMQKLPGCLASPGPTNISGIGNFILPIDHAGRPVARLFFIDSHAYTDHSRKQYDWIRQDQIDWFVHSPHDLPALMFFHIPLPEYDHLWNAGSAEGSKHESVCCPQFNSGFFSAMKTTGDVMGVFVGHDHTNDYIGNHQGMHLCYGRATGFASYGKAGFPRGARMIRLTAGAKTFETWLSLDRKTNARD